MVGLTAVGLILDVVGAFLIAVPDLPRIRTWFRCGQLQRARQQMELGGVSKGDVGFETLVQLHSEMQPNIDITSDDVVRIAFEPTERYEFDSGNVIGTQVESAVTIEYADEAEFSGLNIGSTTLGDPNHLYRLMFRDINEGEKRLRGGGFTLLSTGFLLQLIGTIL